MAGATGHDLIPAAPNRRVQDVFIWYARRLARKKFHALRLDPASLPCLESLAGEPRPVLVAMNHSSWWDPILGVLVGSRFCRERSHLSPMDSVQLRRFSFFRRLGLFGINPDSPASMDAMLAYILERFRVDPSPILWITPQGEFTDVREPVRVRPGLAALASRLTSAGAGDGLRMVAMASELAFWQDARPEVFIRVVDVPPPPAPGLGAWQRTITGAMQANADALAALVRARDPGAFTNLLGAGPATGAARVHPVYDLYLRLTGRSGRLTTRAERLAPAHQGGRP
jgi:1-acyl-sn-glycerol-3-phosphate acyltransferase